MSSLPITLVMAMLSFPPNPTPGIINMVGAGRFEATLLANVSVGLLPLSGSNVIFCRLRSKDLFWRGIKLLQLEALIGFTSTLFSLPGAHDNKS